MKKFLTTLLLMIMSFPMFAQNPTSAFDESIYASGKIYVVVICAAIILLGLILYLFTLDRRLKRLEKYSDPKS